MIKNKFLTAMIVIIPSICVAEGGAFDETHGYFGGEISLFNRTHYNSGNTPDLNLFKSSNSDSKLAIQKNEPGLNFFAGMRFTENLALELGFGFIQKVSAGVQNGNTATNKISNFYLDGLGYLPVAACVDLVGSIGLGLMLWF